MTLLGHRTPPPGRSGLLGLRLVPVAVGLAVGVFAFSAARSPQVTARPGGIAGYSGNPGTNQGATCTTCHSGGIVPDVELVGPTRVSAGTTHAYTLTISGGQRAFGGLDVSATSGRLDIVAGAKDVQLLQDEVVHTEPKRAERAGRVTFEFTWTAPATAGRSRLYGAGNSVNHNGDPSGDAPDTDSLVLEVVAAETPTPFPTVVLPHPVAVSDLANPHGISVAPDETILVSEGGTRVAYWQPGSFAPGAGDGRVQRVNLAMPEQRAVLAAGLTNAVDPGGEEGENGIDSNPWRLATGPDGRVFVVDAGANAILALDLATRGLSTWAVFRELTEGQQAIPTGLAFMPDDPTTAYVSLLGPFGPGTTEIRRLHDANGDGDMMDSGEQSTLVDGLKLVTDVAFGPADQLFFTQIISGTLSRIDPGCWSAGSPCAADDHVVVADQLPAASGLAFLPGGDALVATTNQPSPEGRSLNTNRIVRIPAGDLLPEPTATATVHPSRTPSPMTATSTSGTPSPTPGTTTPGTPTASATVLTPTPRPGGTAYLPVASRGATAR